MTPPANDVIRLIRLHDGALNSAEAAVLRERLASEPELRHKWQQISEALESRQLTTVSDTSDPEDVAVCLEAGADLTETLVAEVAALDRAERAESEPVSAVPARVRQTLQAAVFGQLAPFEEAAAPAVHRNGYVGHAASVSKPLARLKSTDKLAAYPTHHRLRLALIAVACGVVIVLGIVIATRPSAPEVVRHPDKTESPPPVAPHIPEKITPPVPESPPIVRDETPPEVPEPERPVVSEDPPKPEPPKEIPLEPWKWDRIFGLIAARESDGAAWRAANVSDEPGTAVELRALGESWGTAGFPWGGRMVLGEQAVVTLSARKREVPWLQIHVQRGRFAVQQLTPRAFVQLQARGVSCPIQVEATDTAIAVDPREASDSFFVLQGSVSILKEKFTAPAVIHFVDAYPVAKRFNKKLAWVDRPPSNPALQRRLADSLASADDLLTALMTTSPDQNAAEAELVAVWGCSLDAPAVAPWAVSSTQRGLREGALQWLAAADSSAPETSAAWDAVDARLGLANVSPRWWMIVAAKPSLLKITDIQDLGRGIGVNQPVFVREAAIHAIRRLTGQRLPRYDAENPSQAAISEVRQTLRLLNNRLAPPMRGTPQRGRGG